MIVCFENDPFLACGGMASSIGCIDWIPVDVVQHQAYERLVEPLADRVVRDRCAVVERGAIPADMYHDLGTYLDVVAQEQQNESVGSLLTHQRHEFRVHTFGLPPLL